MLYSTNILFTKVFKVHCMYSMLNSTGVLIYQGFQGSLCSMLHSTNIFTKVFSTVYNIFFILTISSAMFVSCLVIFMHEFFHCKTSFRQFQKNFTVKGITEEGVTTAGDIAIVIDIGESE